MTVALRALSVFLLAVILAAPPTAAHAAEKKAQRWGQSERTAIAVNVNDPRAPTAAGKLTVNNVTTDIHFDPRRLDASNFWIGATFMPVVLPGNRQIDNQTVREASAMFFSQRIVKTADNQFNVEGMFNMNGRKQPLVIPMTVTFDKTSTSPRLIFSGHFDAPVGQMSPGLGLPTQIPVSFYVEADPIP